MNKRIIIGLTTAVLLATSAMAYGGNKNQGNENTKSCDMQSSKQKNSKMLIKMIMNLDLTDKQRDEIISIVKENMQNMPNPSKAFSDKSFDKKEFIKLSKERRESRVERKADTIEKVYKLLNSSQKKDLRTMLDMKEIMKKNKNCNTKNCNIKK